MSLSESAGHGAAKFTIQQMLRDGSDKVTLQEMMRAICELKGQGVKDPTVLQIQAQVQLNRPAGDVATSIPGDWTHSREVTVTAILALLIKNEGMTPSWEQVDREIRS